MRQRGIPSLTLVSIFVGQGGGEHTGFCLTGLDVQRGEGNLRSRARQLSLPLQSPCVLALMCPKRSVHIFPPARCILASSSAMASPWSSAALCCSSPEALACRTLTVLPLSPSRFGKKQAALKEQIEAEKSPTQPKKKPRGEGEEGCYPAMYS